MNKLYDYFKLLNKENKISQAFLIGNVLFDDIEEQLYEIFNDYFIPNSLTNIKNNPDIYILKNEEGVISKDDIKELLSNLSTTSQFNNVKIYVIDQCEKLNDFACNAILKTLEEPESGIFAFLITNNINQVLPTIVSRCQNIFISSYTSASDYDKEYEEYANRLINIIESKKDNSFSELIDFYNIKEKEIIIKILEILLIKYNDAMNTMINDVKSDTIITCNNDILSLAKKLIIINDTIYKLNNSLNKNLSIDRFVIEMWRSNNERN